MSLEHSPERSESPWGGAGIPSLAEALQSNPLFLDAAIDTREASEITNTPTATLETLRTRGGGPSFSKRGSRVFYTRRACLEWLESFGLRKSTSDDGPEANAA